MGGAYLRLMSNVGFLESDQRLSSSKRHKNGILLSDANSVSL